MIDSDISKNLCKSNLKNKDGAFLGGKADRIYETKALSWSEG